jgi:hypothetical protein
LQLEMGSMCPKDTNRWVHLERFVILDARTSLSIVDLD